MEGNQNIKYKKIGTLHGSIDPISFEKKKNSMPSILGSRNNIVQDQNQTLNDSEILNASILLENADTYNPNIKNNISILSRKKDQLSKSNSQSNPSKTRKQKQDVHNQLLKKHLDRIHSDDKIENRLDNIYDYTRFSEMQEVFKSKRIQGGLHQLHDHYYKKRKMSKIGTLSQKEIGETLKQEGSKSMTKAVLHVKKVESGLFTNFEKIVLGKSKLTKLASHFEFSCENSTTKKADFGAINERTPKQNEIFNIITMKKPKKHIRNQSNGLTSVKNSVGDLKKDLRRQSTLITIPQTSPVQKKQDQENLELNLDSKKAQLQQKPTIEISSVLSGEDNEASDKNPAKPVDQERVLQSSFHFIRC